MLNFLNLILFSSKPKKAEVVCPHCGAHQMEPVSAISTVCRSCGKNFKLEKALKPRKPNVSKGKDFRTINCFDCHTLLEVAGTAISTICHTCSRHIDLNDYTISVISGRSLETKGALYLTEKGSLTAEKITVSYAQIKGRLKVKFLKCEGIVELYPTAIVDGDIFAKELKVMADARFTIAQQVEVDAAEIMGTVRGKLICHGKVKIEKNGFFEGDLIAKAIDMAPGGTLRGPMRINNAPELEKPSALVAPDRPLIIEGSK